jgi:hypothetical protein
LRSRVPPPESKPRRVTRRSKQRLQGGQRRSNCNTSRPTRAPLQEALRSARTSEMGLAIHFHCLLRWRRCRSTRPSSPLRGGYRRRLGTSRLRCPHLRDSTWTRSSPPLGTQPRLPALPSRMTHPRAVRRALSLEATRLLRCRLSSRPWALSRTFRDNRDERTTCSIHAAPPIQRELVRSRIPSFRSTTQRCLSRSPACSRDQTHPLPRRSLRRSLRRAVRPALRRALPRADRWSVS